MTKKLLLTALILAMTSSLFASPVSLNGRLSVDGLQLVNECGSPVQLRGVSTHGIQWFGQCVNTDTQFDFISNTMNADVIRIAMYLDQGCGYICDPVGMTAKVNQIVNAAEARGMYAIIDWHILYISGSPGTGDPNTYITQARTFWELMANTYKDKKHVLYEICNEPSPSRYTVTWDMIKTYANDIIPRIRAIDPDSVILVGTPNWSQLGSEVIASPLSYSNIMYVFHFYAGTHQVDWFLNPAVGVLPLFCTEWGVTNSSGTGGTNLANADAFLNIMGGANSAGVKISWANWSFSDKAEDSAALKPSTCSGSTWDTSRLTASGIYVRNRIMTPGKTFVACVPTFTVTPSITGTPPTFTTTPTITETHTITQTHTITPTHTVSPTTTATPTYAPDLVLKEEYAYPNPSNGDKITFRYRHKGAVVSVKIKIFTYSDRKIAEVADTVIKTGEPGFSATEWTPAWKLGNGLYYYVLELTGIDKTIVRKTGALVVLRRP